MKLRIYPTGNRRPRIVPAPKRRDWLDALEAGHGYRCLPLTIGSQYGWQVLCDYRVVAFWEGGDGTNALQVNNGPLAASHFGHGLLTFFPGYLFRTPPGWDLLVTGPANTPKAATPLTGVVECDRGPHTWSMNWRMQPNRAEVWEEGEPFCQFYPVKRGELEKWRLEEAEMPPDLRSEYQKWAESRLEHLKTNPNGWQKDYYTATKRHRLNLRTSISPSGTPRTPFGDGESGR